MLFRKANAYAIYLLHFGEAMPESWQICLTLRPVYTEPHSLIIRTRLRIFL